MKKRLRKKKHKGEFAEFGRQFIVRRNKQSGFDEFLDWFIIDVVEKNGCVCGGGGERDRLDMVIELGRRDENPELKKEKILKALMAHPDVKHVLVGDEFDLWYGLYDDIQEE